LSPSFGHSCGGRARTGALLALLATTLSVQYGLEAAFGAPGLPASIPFSLGFGPSSLSPVSDGVPIYTVGDTIWAASRFSNSVPVSLTSAKADASAPSGVVAMQLLGPQAVTPLHTFTPTDADGIWNITIGNQLLIPVRFVNPTYHTVSLGPLQYSLDAGNLSISAQAGLGDSYDQEVCAGGDTAGAGVSLSLPARMQDTGKVILIPGAPFTIVTSGQVNESTAFWFELYHPYGRYVGGANSVAVDDLMTAASRPVALASNATSTTALTSNMPLREGRYDLRAYFQNSSSLDVVQSRVLVVNDSRWVSLSGSSCQPQAIQSQRISYSASLTGGHENWPRNFYIMYRTLGVESVASYLVDANISSVNFVASPWEQPLQGVKVNVSPAPGVIQTSQEGSSLFVLASKYPVQLNYSLDFGGGRDLAQGSLKVTERYTTQTSAFETAELTVHVLSDQSSPTTLDVTGPGGVDITRGAMGSNQTKVLLLPTGSYAVTASQGGNSQSVQVGLTDGLATSVSLNLGAFPALEVILVVTATAAAVANVAVWVLRSRSLSSRLAPRSK
jgi:hypothetical protein